MNHHMTAAIAAARRADLQRAADCCTALPRHRRALERTAPGRLTLATLRRRPGAEPLGCCA